MLLVFARGSILKIAQSIIVLVAVFVIYFQIVWADSEKGGTDKPMDANLAAIVSR